MEVDSANCDDLLSYLLSAGWQAVEIKSNYNNEKRIIVIPQNKIKAILSRKTSAGEPNFIQVIGKNVSVPYEIWMQWMDKKC